MSASHPNEITPHVIRWIQDAIERAPPGHIPLLFLSGPQGSGKTTALAEAVAALPVPVAGLGLDDFYMTKSEREALADQVSPLFLIRGPPGTHDLTLLHHALASLRAASETSATSLPVFDKLADDRAPAGGGRMFTGRPAAIVVEGWLMGVAADPGAPDTPPINSVERMEVNAVWRRYQETALASLYAPLWDEADAFLHILPPGFECVLDWRLEQEIALWAASGQIMPPALRNWTARFIEHYERLTRRMVSGQRRPGMVIRIDAHRQVLKTSVHG